MQRPSSRPGPGGDLCAAWVSVRGFGIYCLRPFFRAWAPPGLLARPDCALRWIKDAWSGRLWLAGRGLPAPLRLKIILIFRALRECRPACLSAGAAFRPGQADDVSRPLHWARGSARKPRLRPSVRRRMGPSHSLPGSEAQAGQPGIAPNRPEPERGEDGARTNRGGASRAGCACRKRQALLAETPLPDLRGASSRRRHGPLRWCLVGVRRGGKIQDPGPRSARATARPRIRS